MDYLGFRAFDSILRNQSFSVAAQELNISQSAISQRMNQLESSLGNRLLVRSLPFKATDLGERVLAHYRKMQLLEQEFSKDLNIQNGAPPEFRICLNSDSLELWFNSVLKDSSVAGSLRLIISLDDERFTLRHLIEGRVDLAIGTSSRKIQNHDCFELGNLDYVLVCSSAFKSHHFAKGFNDSSIQNLTAVVFNEKDDLHTECLSRVTNQFGGIQTMCVPSLYRLKDAILSGFGYGVMPKIEVAEELKAGTLVMPHPKAKVTRKLYLHHWSYRTRAMMTLIKAIDRAAKTIR